MSIITFTINIVYSYKKTSPIKKGPSRNSHSTSRFIMKKATMNYEKAVTFFFLFALLIVPFMFFPATASLGMYACIWFK